MRAYVAGRLVTAVLVILGVSVVSFFLTFLTGDPAEIMLPPGATAAQIEKFRVEWGFADPLPVQYWRFLKRAAHGDFGVSLRHGQSSLRLIVARLPATLQLTACGGRREPEGAAPTASVRCGRIPRRSRVPQPREHVAHVPGKIPPDPRARAREPADDRSRRVEAARDPLRPCLELRG